MLLFLLGALKLECQLSVGFDVLVGVDLVAVQEARRLLAVTNVVILAPDGRGRVLGHHVAFAYLDKSGETELFVRGRAGGIELEVALGRVPLGGELVDFALDERAAVLVEPGLPVDVAIHAELEHTAANVRAAAAVDVLVEAGRHVHELVVVGDLVADCYVANGDHQRLVQVAEAGVRVAAVVEVHAVLVECLRFVACKCVL